MDPNKDEKQIIGIADMKMAKGSGTLITYALGSCIGICLYDSVTCKHFFNMTVYVTCFLPLLTEIVL